MLRLHALALAAFALLSTGCNALSAIGPSACDRSPEGNPTVRYTEGTVEAGVYMSSSWDGDLDEGGGGLLYFPGGMRYSIEHGLGATPRWWQLYLSFDRHGTATGSLAQAAGNQAEVIDIDDQQMEIVNGSCSDYWLLVVAGAGDVAGP